jgi:tetratricopeptide (TPR) repeat protein
VGNFIPIVDENCFVSSEVHKLAGRHVDGIRPWKSSPPCKRIVGLGGPVLAVLVVWATLCHPGAEAAQSPALTQIAGLIREGKLDLAEQRLQLILSHKPHSASALNLLGIVYLRQQRYNEAEEPLRAAIAADPGLIDALRNLGEVYIAEDKKKDAEAAYAQAVKIFLADPKSNLALAKLYQESGQFQLSLDAASRIEPAQRTPSLLPILAADYVGLNQPEKATLEVRSMLQVAEKNPELVPQFVDFLIERGAVGDADELLKISAQQQKSTDEFLYDVARVQALKGDRAQARDTLARVLQDSPRFLNALTEAGRLAGLDLDWSRAVDFLSRAETLAPRRVDILQGLVMAELYSYQPENALHTARKLQASQPDDLRSSYFMALALAANHQWPEARPFVENVLRSHPTDEEMNVTLAAIAYNTNDMNEARKHLEFCLSRNPSNAGALYYLGLVEKVEGDLAGATKTLAQSVAINPRNAESQSALGGLYLQTGDLPRAREALEEAVKLWPEGADNHYKLALVYKRSGFPDKADEQLAIYQKVMDTVKPKPVNQ